MSQEPYLISLGLFLHHFSSFYVEGDLERDSQLKHEDIDNYYLKDFQTSTRHPYIQSFFHYRFCCKLYNYHTHKYDIQCLLFYVVIITTLCFYNKWRLCNPEMYGRKKNHIIHCVAKWQILIGKFSINTQAACTAKLFSSRSRPCLNSFFKVLHQFLTENDNDT